jgi:hypothetical protein
VPFGLALAARPAPASPYSISDATGSRLRRQLANRLATCLDHSLPGQLVHVWSAGSQLRRTISLGTGLSCFPDHSICSSEAICLVRECPPQTISDRAIGHATGTPALTAGLW